MTVTNARRANALRTHALRSTAAVGAGAAVAALLLTAPTPADAARACKIEVTTRLDKTVRFEDGGVVRNYFATAQGSAVGLSNHSGNVIMTTFPQGAYPSLVHRKIGEREAIGSMVQSQAPTAIGGINADFFVFADIRYATDIEMARGPMVSGGTIIRGSAKELRVVGIDSSMAPFGGTLAVRGVARARVDGAPRIAVRSVNWHKVLGGGLNLYTTSWSRTKQADGRAAYPRPAGAAEWVISSRDKITSIRTATLNSAALGAPVARGSRVLAFSVDTAGLADDVPVGTRVNLTVRQKTDTGATLQTAVGRGLTLVEAGRPAPLGCRAYAQGPGAISARPRTFVGWDDMGRWRAFTVPGSYIEAPGGKLSRTGGFGLANAANIAKKLRMSYAYELDGGGSTSLWTRRGAEWTRRDLYRVKNPSGCTCERSMANGLAFLPPS